MPGPHLVLVLDGLLPGTTFGSNADRAGEPAPPGLASLFALAQSPQVESGGWPAALAGIYGFDPGSDVPLGPLLAAEQGVDTTTRFWLCADPVELEAGRDDLRLRRAVDDLDASETGALLATLNAHFAGDDLRFHAGRRSGWFVSSGAPQRLSTCPLPLALGRPLRTRQPFGPEASRWLRWGSEAQMLLHDHPVNAARAVRGAPIVNSVWIWGSGSTGRPPAVPPEPDLAIDTHAGDPLTAALATAIGRPARPVPADLAAALGPSPGMPPTTESVTGPGGSSAASGLVVVPGRTEDLPALERHWLGPAWRALVTRAVTSVTLIVTLHDRDDTSAYVLRVRPPSLRQRLALRLRPVRPLSVARLAASLGRPGTESSRQ